MAKYNNKVSIGLARSLLFVPGNRPDRIVKALETKADMVIIDLEDAVPNSEKESIRPIVKEKIADSAIRPVMARVNSLSTGLTENDLVGIIGANLNAIMLPKVESSNDVENIDAILHRIERNNGLEIGKIGLILLIETALGVENAFNIASTDLCTDRPRTLAFGAADFALDMGITLEKYGAEIDFPRARIAVACRAAKLSAPVDTPFMIDINDMEALKNDIRRAKSLGFGGKLCIHPKQIDLCNQLFSPTVAEIEYAAKVVTAFEKAEKRGQGVIQLDGKMIDSPVVSQSFEILELSRKIGHYPE